MTKTIFRNIFLVGVLVLIICGVIFFGVQYKQTVDETFAAMEQETIYVSEGLSLAGESYLEKLDDNNRVTWIDADGEALYDSEFGDELTNQKECEEVAEAFSLGEGKSTRKSESSGKTTMYYARKCSDGTVLRLSRPSEAVRHALLTVSPILWVLVLVLLISAILAFRAANQIVAPINALDLENVRNNPYLELAPLLDKIEEQKLTIQEEAAAREEMRREFSANVSHELKTPLTSISGFAELMSQGIVSGDKVTEFSKDIYKESQRMISLIDDIIKLSKLDENAVGPKRDAVDLKKLAMDVAEKLKPAGEARAISIEARGESAKITGAYTLLYEMIYNLCENAVKYNVPGGKVVIETSEDTEQAVISVADTGIGIAPEHQKRVFERFYRVDKSHSKEIGGTGLGLSIVKHGALYHDAKVELESELGHGTTIKLIFPKNNSDS